MSDRLLRRHEIAAMLGTTPGVAVSILAKYGAYPIDFGMGRSRGPRWLESAVKNALIAMHHAAQPKPSTKPTSKPHISSGALHLHEMTTDQVYNLTKSRIVQ